MKNAIMGSGLELKDLALMYLRREKPVSENVDNN